MSTRESRRARGRRIGRAVAARLVGELTTTRTLAGVSQDALGRAIGTSQSEISKLERLVRIDDISFVRVAEVASLLGLELSAALYPRGDPIRDKGQQALAGRFRSILAPQFRVLAEALLPGPGDRRSWDMLLRLARQLTGVEIETRIRDIQWLVRRMRERERDGGVDHILLVLSDSSTNRRLLPQLLEALGERYATPRRQLLAALRAGRPLPGSGVVLL